MYALAVGEKGICLGTEFRFCSLSGECELDGGNHHFRGVVPAKSLYRGWCGEIEGLALVEEVLALGREQGLPGFEIGHRLRVNGIAKRYGKDGNVFSMQLLNNHTMGR